MNNKIKDLRIRVGNWSQANFDNQVSKYNPSVVLDHLAPLLGIAEEIGELCEAETKDCLNGKKDAIGDIVIYTCDFATRLGINFEDYTVENADSEDLLPESLKLFHHVLKMHQGIRGYGDKEFALTEIKQSIYSTFDCLHELCNVYGIEPPFTIATDVFNNTVSSRDWKKNPNGDY